MRSIVFSENWIFVLRVVARRLLERTDTLFGEQDELLGSLVMAVIEEMEDPYAVFARIASEVERPASEADLGPVHSEGPDRGDGSFSGLGRTREGGPARCVPDPARGKVARLHDRSNARPDRHRERGRG